MDAEVLAMNTGYPVGMESACLQRKQLKNNMAS